LTFESWETIAKLAPIGTALIALVAALIALYSITIVARRRAAIDFFLKTETDEKLIDLYEAFKALRLDLKDITTQQQYEEFKKRKQDPRDVRAFLNLLELIAVGIRRHAFSDTISFHYWGDVLLQGWEASRTYVGFMRKDAAEGTTETLQDLEILYGVWKKRDDKAKRKAQKQARRRRNGS
jgi:hypothetical protein